MSETPDWLTDLLAEHQMRYDRAAAVCEAGDWRQDPVMYPDAAHRAHVADVVWAEFGERVKAEMQPADMDACRGWAPMPSGVLDSLLDRLESR